MAKSYKSECDECGAVEDRIPRSREPMLMVSLPDDRGGRPETHDFCDITCLARWATNEAAEIDR